MKIFPSVTCISPPGPTASSRAHLHTGGDMIISSSSDRESDRELAKLLRLDGAGRRNIRLLYRSGRCLRGPVDRSLVKCTRPWGGLTEEERCMHAKKQYELKGRETSGNLHTNQKTGLSDSEER